MLVALSALFVALGGSSYAAVELRKNSVATKHLKRHAVGAKQLKRNAVGTRQLKNNAVGTAQLKPNAVNGSKVADGSLTGADVNTSTLGTVPNASNAATAQKAVSAATAQNASALNGFRADHLVRAAKGNVENFFSVVSFSALTSVTVTAPTGGHVLVTATVGPSTSDGANCASSCFAHVRLAEPSASRFSSAWMAGLRSPGGAIDGAVSSATWIFPATPGQHTYALQAGKFPAAADIDFRNPAIAAVFVPFGGDGEQGP